MSGVIWLGEGLIFGRQLGFKSWQIVSLMTAYAGIFAAVVYFMLRSGPHSWTAESTSLNWRVHSVVPVAAFIVGSFVSLPLLLIIEGLGKVF